MKDISSEDAQGHSEPRAASRHSMHASKLLPNRAITDALIKAGARWKSKPGVSVAESSGTLLDHGRKPGILVQGGKSPRVIIEPSYGADGDSAKQPSKADVGRYAANGAIASRIPEDFRAMRQSRLACAFM